MKFQLSIQRNYKMLCFQVFLKDRDVLEFSQTSKMKPFVKVVNSLIPLTIFTKSSILDV